MKQNDPPDAEVLIAGAGPVGLFLAALLGARGVRCLLVERRAQRPQHSRAIGVMPPTLAMFRAVGVADTVTAAGCRVHSAVVHDARQVLGTLAFNALPGPFPFVLAIPQNELMGILEAAVAATPSVAFHRSTELVALAQDDEGVTAELRGSGAATRTVRARFLAACDGAGGDLRAWLEVDAPVRPYAPSFLMGDYADRTGWGDAAHLFFTPGGSVESFPLPQQGRRWVVLADPCAAGRDAAELRRRVRALSGVDLPEGDQRWHSAFTPEYRLNRRYVRGRVACCGDSAHVMSPIGGQGMNTGFADAWHLARALDRTVHGGQPHAPLLARYEACRRLAFHRAARRAAGGMWIGTRTGRLPSALRSRFIRYLLFGTPLRHRLAPFFAMLTIPGSRDAAHAPPPLEQGP